MSDNILTRIQAEIHAPKGKRNEFGKFNYRSAEDILSAAKPILASYDQSLVLSDEIVQIGDRYYVKATAVIHPLGANSVAFAREQIEKKGMDQAQVTGAASSYARKYALAGLFALDNEKDPDSGDNRETPEKKTATAVDADMLDYQLVRSAEQGLEALKTAWTAIGGEAQRAVGGAQRLKELKEMAKPATTTYTPKPDISKEDVPF